MPSPARNKTATDQIILLRFLVAYLGEKEQAGWWDTTFLSPTGIKFLQNPFPRTAHTAAFFSAAEAARLVHDSKIGRIGVFHLFRLPPEQEEALQIASRKSVEPDWQTRFCERELALSELKSHGLKEAAPVAGPIQVGAISNIFQPSALAELAARYHAAFVSGTPAYPYFAA